MHIRSQFTVKNRMAHYNIYVFTLISSNICTDFPLNVHILRKTSNYMHNPVLLAACGALAKQKPRNANSQTLVLNNLVICGRLELPTSSQYNIRQCS